MNERWSLDFVSDAAANGQTTRVLTVVDDYTRECLATEVDTSLPGLRVVRTLNRELRVEFGDIPLPQKPVRRFRHGDPGQA
jgi:transposase InsO family protein